MRRTIHLPLWWMLLMANLANLSGQGSLVGMERFARRQRHTHNDLLGSDFGMSPSDSWPKLPAWAEVGGIVSSPCPNPHLLPPISI
jgi:hypothetical protein